MAAAFLWQGDFLLVDADHDEPDDRAAAIDTLLDILHPFVHLAVLAGAGLAQQLGICRAEDIAAQAHGGLVLALREFVVRFDDGLVG